METMFLTLTQKMIRREGTSKSHSVVAGRRFAAKTKFAQICDSHRKINIARDPAIRFGSKQRKITRREGTSKSNWVVARRRFAAKTNLTQMCDSHRKINIARDPTDRFGSKTTNVCVEHDGIYEKSRNICFRYNFQQPRSSMEVDFFLTKLRLEGFLLNVLLQDRGRRSTYGLRDKGLVEKAIACEQS